MTHSPLTLRTPTGPTAGLTTASAGRRTPQIPRWRAGMPPRRPAGPRGGWEWPPARCRPRQGPWRPRGGGPPLEIQAQSGRPSHVDGCDRDGGGAELLFDEAHLILTGPVRAQPPDRQAFVVRCHEASPSLRLTMHSAVRPVVVCTIWHPISTPARAPHWYTVSSSANPCSLRGTSLNVRRQLWHVTSDGVGWLVVMAVSSVVIVLSPSPGWIAEQELLALRGGKPRGHGARGERALDLVGGTRGRHGVPNSVQGLTLGEGLVLEQVGGHFGFPPVPISLRFPCHPRAARSPVTLIVTLARFRALAGDENVGAGDVRCHDALRWSGIRSEEHTS